MSILDMTIEPTIIKTYSFVSPLEKGNSFRQSGVEMKWRFYRFSFLDSFIAMNDFELTGVLTHYVVLATWWAHKALILKRVSWLITSFDQWSWCLESISKRIFHEGSFTWYVLDWPRVRSWLRKLRKVSVYICSELILTWNRSKCVSKVHERFI